LINSNIIQKGIWEKISCSICNEEQKLFQLGKRQEYAITRNFFFEFDFKDTICEKCGFVFERFIPDDNFLKSYYSDAHFYISEVTKIESDFDRKNRISAIKQFVNIGSTILEIGANDGTFCKFLTELGFLAKGIDPINSDSKNINQQFIKTENDSSDNFKFDCIVSYYVLEHVRKPKEWICEIIKNLNESGILIFEVPNFYTYPLESLNFEHLQHFTPFHLKLLLENLGFEVMSCDEFLPSRYFGFTIVAKLKNKQQVNDKNFESVDSKIIEKGKETYLEYNNIKQKNKIYYQSIINKVIEKIENDKKNIYFWGANIHSTNLNMMLKNFEGNLIDSGKTKIGTYHLGFSNSIISPNSEDIKNPFFVICSPNFESEIEKQIISMGFSKSSIIHGYGLNNDQKLPLKLPK
jgi:SAM-dependent methyltransferase